MAVNESRSMNADLQQGVRDGSYKSLTPDRSPTEDAAVLRRANELQSQYRIADIQKYHPTGCECGYC